MTSLRFSLTLSRYPLLCIWLKVLLLFRAPSPVLPLLACSNNYHLDHSHHHNHPIMYNYEEYHPNHHDIILYVVQEADAVRNRKKYTSINIEHQLLACRENDLARSLAGSTSDTVWKSFSTWEASSRRDVFRPRSDIPPFEIHSSLSFSEAGSKQLLNLIPFLRHC